MSVQVQTRRVSPGILVLTLSGSVSRCADPSADDPLIDDLLEQGERQLIFDLAAVEHMDSSGVHRMYACHSAVREAGGELRFAGATPRVARLFEMTRLDTVLSFYPSVSAACESLTPGRKSTA